jgi:hypothetical protein
MAINFNLQELKNKYLGLLSGAKNTLSNTWNTGVQNVKTAVKTNPSQFNLASQLSKGNLATGIKPLDYTAQKVGSYMNNMWIQPALQVPGNIRDIIKPKPMNVLGRDLSPNQARLANVGKLGLNVLSAVPDPTEIPFAAYNYLKGISAAKQQGLKGWDVTKAGVNSATFENLVGLGTALTKNPTGEMIGNLAEFPLILAGGIMSKKMAMKSLAEIKKNAPAVKDFISRARATDLLNPQQQMKVLGELDKFVEMVQPGMTKGKEWVKLAVSDKMKYGLRAVEDGFYLAFHPEELKYAGLGTREMKGKGAQAGLYDTNKPGESYAKQLGIEIKDQKSAHGGHGGYSATDNSISIPSRLPKDLSRDEIIAHEIGHQVMKTEISQPQLDIFNQLIKENRPEVDASLRLVRTYESRMSHQGYLEHFADLYGKYIRGEKLPAGDVFKNYFDEVAPLSKNVLPTVSNNTSGIVNKSIMTPSTNAPANIVPLTNDNSMFPREVLQPPTTQGTHEIHGNIISKPGEGINVAQQPSSLGTNKAGLYDAPLYHGTTKQFDNFDLTKAGTRNPADQGFAGKGIYLSNSKEVAETFSTGKDIYKTVGDQGTPRIIETRLKPGARVLEVKDFTELSDKLGLPRSKNRPINMKLSDFTTTQSPKIREKAMSMGYDAIKIDGGGIDKYGTPTYEMVVFDPKNVAQQPSVPSVSGGGIDSILAHYKQFPQGVDMEAVKVEFKNNPSALKAIEKAQLEVSTKATQNKILNQQESVIASKMNNAKTVGELRAAEAEMNKLRSNITPPPKGVEVKGKMVVPEGRISTPQVATTTTPEGLTKISPEELLKAGGGQGNPTQPIIPPTDPVEKIIQALKVAKPLEKEQAGIYSKIRSQQTARVTAMGAKVPGEQGYFAQLGQLKGEMPKVQFESIRKQITQPDIDSLFNKVEQSSLSPFEKVSAKSGLAKLLGAEGGSVPVQSELKLLNEIFPPEFVQSILNKRSTMQKLFSLGEEALNLPRAMMATADLSAPLRQGVFLIGRPKQWIPAFKDMFKYAFSEKAYNKAFEAYKSDALYPIMRENKLALTDMSPMLLSREESFMSNLAEKIPGFGVLAKGSNRAYSGFLNKLRFDTFKDLYNKADVQGLVKDNPKIVSDITRFINSATGRGDLGTTINKASAILNGAFFSPRLMMSRLNLLNPVYYAKLEPFVRKEALTSLLTFAGTGLTILGLAKLGGAEVSADPRSADFGKIKIGDTRFDTWGGFQQYLVLAGRLITGQMVSSTTGKEFNLGEGYKPTTRMDIIQRFFESKESPIASFATALLKGQTNMGEKLNIPVEVIDRFIPMVIQDMYDLYREYGPAGIVGSIPGMFGVGSQTYTDQIPMAGKTATGKPNVQWRQAPGLGETILNKVTGKQISNIPKEEWQPLIDKRKEESLWNIKLDAIKKTVLETEQTQTVVNPVTNKTLQIYLKDGVVTTKDITPKTTSSIKTGSKAKKGKKFTIKKVKIPKIKLAKVKKIKVAKLKKMKKYTLKTPKLKTAKIKLSAKIA